MISKVLILLIPPILGGFLGAWIVYILNKKKDRIILTLQVFNDIENLIEDIEKAYFILKYNLSSDGKVFIPGQDEPKLPISKAKEIQQKSKEMNDIVIKVGDCLEKVALLYLYRKISIPIFKKTNVYEIINNFIVLIKTKNFKVLKYNVKSTELKTDYYFIAWEKGWPYLFELSQDKSHSLLRTIGEYFF